MFTLWYIVLGAKEYCKDGKARGPIKSAPAPPTPTKPDLIPKPSDPIPVAKPQTPALPVVDKTPEPAKPAPVKPARPDPPKQSPPKNPAPPQPPRQSPAKPSPPPSPRPSPPKVTEPVKPKASPPKTPEFKPQTPPPRPNLQSREDELFAKTLNFGQKSDQNGSRFTPQDLSYSSVAKGDPNSRLAERQVVSNPDSLESSEAED